jgi:chromosome segregation ATPase
MRLISLVTLLTVPLVSQTRDPGGDTVQTLLAEVRQLRFAIERSTLLGTRMQIALQRIQIQEGRTSRLLQELESVRKDLRATQGQQGQLAERIKELEQQASNSTDPATRRQSDLELKAVRAELQIFATREQQVRMREAEVASQIKDEQGRLAELHDRVNQMERALDDSLRQISGGK